MNVKHFSLETGILIVVSQDWIPDRVRNDDGGMLSYDDYTDQFLIPGIDFYFIYRIFFEIFRQYKRLYE
jgi:hypothetical protein